MRVTLNFGEGRELEAELQAIPTVGDKLYIDERVDGLHRRQEWTVKSIVHYLRKHGRRSIPQLTDHEILVNLK